MTILDEILDASTDPAMPTADLLRKVQIAAYRLGATEIVAWALGELSGYADDGELPNYRKLRVIVVAHFSGPYQSSVSQPLTEVPDGMDALWQAELRQPLVELQALAASDDDPSVPWPAATVQKYSQSGVYRIQGYNLFSARKVISRQSLLGLIDAVRTRAMQFALELQAAFPNAGMAGGPTVADPAVAQTVVNITNNITGNGTNIAVGSNAQQTSTVTIGDVEEFRERISELGLSEEDRDEFVATVSEEKTADGPKVKQFLRRVESGAIEVGAKVTTAVAVSTLTALAESFLGARN